MYYIAMDTLTCIDIRLSIKSSNRVTNLKSLRNVQISILKPKKYPRSSKNLSVL